ARPLMVYRQDSGTLELSPGGGVWTVIPDRTDNTYVPTWGSTGTLPSLGNGTIVGDYSQDDLYIDFECLLTLGTTSTVGSGSYTLTAPVAPLTVARGIYEGTFFDSSAGNIYPMPCQIIGGTTTIN